MCTAYSLITHLDYIAFGHIWINKMAEVENPKKRRKYESKYQSKWEEQHSWIAKSDRGICFAYCKTCNVHLSVSHGGINDVNKHAKTTQHVEQLKIR